MKVRIKFRKYGVLKFIGHLDVMRFFQKMMRRAEIPIAFTGGYSPHMIMSFASPLGIGLTSDGEYVDIELTELIDSETAVRRMNAVTAEGIEILSFQRRIILCRCGKERCRINGKNSLRNSFLRKRSVS